MIVRGASCLVTGAGRGIGRAIALALAREGARVTGVSRTAGELASLVDEARRAGGEVLAHAGDLREGAFCAGAVRAAAEAHGRLQVLVNNA
jgi:3-oxoacyl-[acyl-carrier protein] reductase